MSDGVFFMSSCCDQLLFKISNYDDSSITLDLVDLHETDLLCSGLLENKGFVQVWADDIDFNGKHIGIFISETIKNSEKYYSGEGLVNFYVFENEYFIVFLRGHITGENTARIVSFSWEEEELDFTKRPINKLIFNGAL